MLEGKVLRMILILLFVRYLVGENGLFGPLGNDLWDLNSKDGYRLLFPYITYSPYGQVCVRMYICMYYTGLPGCKAMLHTVSAFLPLSLPSSGCFCYFGNILFCLCACFVCLFGRVLSRFAKSTLDGSRARFLGCRQHNNVSKSHHNLCLTLDTLCGCLPKFCSCLLPH